MNFLKIKNHTSLENIMSIVVGIITGCIICMFASIERNKIDNTPIDAQTCVEVSEPNIRVGWFNEEQVYIDAAETDIVSTEYKATDVPYVDEQEQSELARILMHEVGASYIETWEVYYTGSVIINRVNSPYFPNTLHEVLVQEGQYCSYYEYMSSEWTTGLSDLEKERCYSAAYDLLAYGSVIPSNVVYCAMFPQGSGTYARSNTQWFCYE